MQRNFAKSFDFVPRGPSRMAAAYYLGVGTSKFDEMVKDGRMPAPKMNDSRVIWDRLEIDLAFNELRYREAERSVNPWDELLSK